MGNKITISDVAERAGVSRGTVDRVLNNRPHVKEIQKQRVLQAMQELGYEPIRKKQADHLGLKMAEEKVIKIGIVLQNKGEHYLKEIKRGIQDAQSILADFTIDILTEQIETAVPDEIETAIDHLVDKGISGLAISAPDLPRVRKKLASLENIAVITFETDIPDSGRICFFGQDQKTIGRVAGGLMVPFLKAGDRVIAAIGSREIDSDSERLAGFLECLAEHGFPEKDILIVSTLGDYRLTYEKLLPLIQEAGVVRGIYMGNHSVNGCIDAIEAAECPHFVHVIGSDLTETTLRFLARGAVDFCVNPNIYLLGYEPLLMLGEYLTKQKVPAVREIHLAAEIVTAENIQ
ncbi:MAG: LacI family DNA-binding transcriptional regulator [Lachnospiraceae bacterium]|nr:LacI family DNA-binding transcriptional regulator [Lachnospiraceae bacterium]